MLILDYNPVLCAKATPFPMIKGVLEVIEDGYKEACSQMVPVISELQDTYKLIASDLCFSYRNAEWYWNYYNSLHDVLRLINPEIKTQTLDVGLIKGVKDFASNPLNLHSTFCDTQYQKIIKDEKIATDVVNIIAQSRRILEKLEPEFEDFPAGVPAWLACKYRTAWECFDETTQKHYKIKLDDSGNVSCYYALMSNNYKAVKCPDELKSMIKLIISNRPNLTLID